MNSNSYQNILDSLLTAIILVDHNLTVVHMNASAEMNLGVSGEKMSGRSIHACFSASDGTPMSLEEALRNNRNFTKRKASWKLHNNQTIMVDYSVIPSHEMNHMVIEFQPLDRLLKISREEAMLASQETTRNLIRGMAHEIKNPLGGIRGAAQLLARELHHEELEEYTRIIIDETDRLRNLVDRMLGPHKSSERKPTNIHEVLEHVHSVIKAEVGSQITIKRDYDPSIPPLTADRAQLIQAVLNIGRNAMQSLLENGTANPQIAFRTRVQRRYTIGRTHHPLVVKISITDNGPGIPPELIEDIFFPMITGRANGSGLGLAIAQNLVNLHKGIIECASRKGKTEFTIYLPLDTENA
ncbi:nitrogen regulation protein NR(II) [Teredinibacter turnerae]|uniref:Sensory histidine kinase/phosphatase NtrB n=1 Tax=Teredinibacter turnerae (strain ATCC 39867 / T7901) TaxID=377629 RepID=C5BJ21_TERTT|nr:nitrogen regulation protein NR(II) [Teredinibacter turnerae]ACR11822.1 nitrogen regulation protein NR [Teredinibacter turnerae T7901]